MAAEKPSRSTASAPPAGTWLASAARITSELSRRISSCSRPTALFSRSSERSELEQTSSARPSVRCASVDRTGRISCSTTGTPAGCDLPGGLGAGESAADRHGWLASALATWTIPRRPAAGATMAVGEERKECIGSCVVGLFLRVYCLSSLLLGRGAGCGHQAFARHRAALFVGGDGAAERDAHDGLLWLRLPAPAYAGVHGCRAHDHHRT